MKVKVTQLCPTLCDLMDYTVHGILQPEYWSGEPFPSPGDLPNPRIKPSSPALQADSIPQRKKKKKTVVLEMERKHLCWSIECLGLDHLLLRGRWIFLELWPYIILLKIKAEFKKTFRQCRRAANLCNFKNSVSPLQLRLWMWLACCILEPGSLSRLESQGSVSGVGVKLS